MRIALVVVLVILVAVGGVLAWKARQEVTRPVTLWVMVPQGLYVSFIKVEKEFKQLHPNVTIQRTIDTPEAMANMVELNAEKPDIFISPGGHELEVLREKGFIDPASEVAFGSYEAALLVPIDNPGNIEKLEDLLNPEVKTIAISNPDLNAACYAARMSLQNLGIWDKLQSKIKVTKCCNTSYQEIVKGNAEANIQFNGCPMDDKGEMTDQAKAKVVCRFPIDTYYVPRNAVGILKTTKERELAEEFVKLLTAPKTIEMMLQYKMRDDQNMGTKIGPWGPVQEANPKAQKAS